MSFWAALRRVYAQAWAFLWALPLLGAAVIAVEALQHVVEWRDGMYASKAGLIASAHDQSRLLAGAAKVLWLTTINYWVIRYIVSGSRRATVSADPTAMRAFGLVWSFSVAMALAALWAPELFPAGSHARALAGQVSGILQLVFFPLWVALAPWLVGAAIGDHRAGPLFALRRAWGSVWWGVGLTLAAVLPLMIPHYALGLGAVAQPPAMAIAMLALDAVLVAFLGVVAAASAVPIADRMAQRVGEALPVVGAR